MTYNLAIVLNARFSVIGARSRHVLWVDWLIPPTELCRFIVRPGRGPI